MEMGWTGDWYLWCLFALYYDVGYFADAMVCYREHALSMTTTLEEQNSPALPFGDIAVPWMIKKRADQEGLDEVSQDCLDAIAYTYIRVMNRAEYSISASQFEESLSQYAVTDPEKMWLRARVYAGVGDGRYWQGHSEDAKRLYRASLTADPSRANVRAKVFLLWLGQGGHLVRRAWRVFAENLA